MRACEIKRVGADLYGSPCTLECLDVRNKGRKQKTKGMAEKLRKWT